MKIRNPHYRRFLDEGIITHLEREHIERVLPKVTGIRGKHIAEARAFIICSYFTGARPVEILQLRAKNIIKQACWIIINMPSSKRGLARPIYLKHKDTLIKELYNYAITNYPDTLLFHNYISTYKRTIQKNGESVKRLEIAAKINYHIKKWFEGVFYDSTTITSYYMRHNRFSKLSEKGIQINDIMQMKGSKTIESVRPYMHLSAHTAKKIARKND